MRLSPWTRYLAASLAACALYLLSPRGTTLQTVWATAIGVLAGLAILDGVRRHRPPAALAWLLFAVGIAANALGQSVEAYVTEVLRVEDPFPGVADAFYLALYPALTAGLAMLVRRRSAHREWAALVDTTTVTTGLALLSWVFVIRPAATDPTLGLLGHAVSVAYPVGDVVLLAMLLRLLLGGGRRTPSFLLIASSLSLFLGGDAAWAVINDLGYAPGSLVEHLLQTTFLCAYTLFGAAALHPSVRQLGERAAPRQPRLAAGQLLLLTSASLIAPAILAYEVARGRVTDGAAIVAGSVVLFLLVVTRMAQLLRQVEQQACQLRSLASSDELTGLPNRRAWRLELPGAMELARRDGMPLSVAMLDLDHFKRYNDQHGHPAGDALLREASAAWRATLRQVDQLARYGGEEFIVLLRAAGCAEACELLERLRTQTPAGQTFSAGVASWDGRETSDELVARADAALYAAKAAGRNRILPADAPAQLSDAA